ncbi:MAG: hypothetical protein KJ043_16985 [Anaerolineae bacterium]|nr:hypothetical protein [Anaerolineae bacterium]
MSLIVEKSVEINAPLSAIWDVLVNPIFIKQWDDVPDTFSQPVLSLGSELIWHQQNGNFTQLKVVIFEPHQKLSQQWYISTLEKPADVYDIRYTYSLSVENAVTYLTITVGDWSKLPHGDEFYQATLEFVETASKAIKDLAEKFN